MSGRRIRLVSLIRLFSGIRLTHSLLVSSYLLDLVLGIYAPPNYSEAIRAKLISTGILGSDAYVVIAGPANTYAHYVTTREEYSIQRYEGASTIFGQCKSPPCPYNSVSLAYVACLINEYVNLVTLEAYIDKYSSLLPFIADHPSGTPPTDAASPEQTSKAISLQVRFFDFVTLYKCQLDSWRRRQ
jgi:Neutral/alkaline non-lysosomal ceramidase, N-terminal